LGALRVLLARSVGRGKASADLKVERATHDGDAWKALASGSATAAAETTQVDVRMVVAACTRTRPDCSPHSTDTQAKEKNKEKGIGSRRAWVRDDERTSVVSLRFVVRHEPQRNS